MKFPLFSPSEDPGPSFLGLLNKLGIPALADTNQTLAADLIHGTTVVGAKWKDGIIMAGDRRATSGSLISYREMEKVHPADSHSGIAIAGVAGPAMEMVHLFQLQLEHYEKLEGMQLSLDGKANQLSTFLKGNFSAAMNGLAAIPLLGGYDLNRDKGRLFQYDITGGRYEERSFAAVGSGSLHARTAIKLSWSENMPRTEAIALLLSSLHEAADEDTGTGGPDVIRGIYPTMALITAEGYQELDEDEIAGHFEEQVGRKQK